jgi:hydrogenase expression/formation protein HypE
MITPTRLDTVAAPPRPEAVGRGEGKRIGSSHEDLLQTSILPRLGNEILQEMLDCAVLRHGNQRLALTVDGYVMRPLKFPGGDIGRLAVCGTVNNLAVAGARPTGLALGMIISESLEIQVLDGVLDSVALAAREAGVRVLTGDTKIVGHAEGDGLHITMAGVGVVSRRVRMHPNQVMPGDVLIVSGPVGGHGIAVLAPRKVPPELRGEVRSDAAPMNRLVEQVLKRVPGVVYMKDPSRGGITGTCRQFARRTGLHVRLDEQNVPVRSEVRRAADLLGTDPLEAECAGQILIFVRPTNVEQALAVLRKDPAGTQAAVIGHVSEPRDGQFERVGSNGSAGGESNPPSASSQRIG